MLEFLDLQMEAAKVTLNGETYIRRAMRWVDDPETGERVRKEVPRARGEHDPTLETAHS